eukprot:g36065.t1
MVGSYSSSPACSTLAGFSAVKNCTKSPAYVCLQHSCLKGVSLHSIAYILLSASWRAAARRRKYRQRRTARRRAAELIPPPTNLGIECDGNITMIEDIIFKLTAFSEALKLYNFKSSILLKLEVTTRFYSLEVISY